MPRWRQLSWTQWMHNWSLPIVSPSTRKLSTNFCTLGIPSIALSDHQHHSLKEADRPILAQWYQKQTPRQDEGGEEATVLIQGDLMVPLDCIHFAEDPWPRVEAGNDLLRGWERVRGERGARVHTCLTLWSPSPDGGIFHLASSKVSLMMSLNSLSSWVFKSNTISVSFFPFEIWLMWHLHLPCLLVVSHILCLLSLLPLHILCLVALSLSWGKPCPIPSFSLWEFGVLSLLLHRLSFHYTDCLLLSVLCHYLQSIYDHY